MTSVTTNACTNVNVANATFNASLISKDATIVSYGFLAKAGTAGYGYDYGTAGALIEVTEATTTGKKKVMIKRA